MFENRLVPSRVVASDRKRIWHIHKHEVCTIGPQRLPALLPLKKYQLIVKGVAA